MSEEKTFPYKCNVCGATDAFLQPAPVHQCPWCAAGSMWPVGEEPEYGK